MQRQNEPLPRPKIAFSGLARFSEFTNFEQQAVFELD